MPLDRSAVTAPLRRQLLAAANPAGWGYYVGKQSRIESTCWSLLALEPTWEDELGSWAAFAAPHLAWLRSRQTVDGLMIETEPSLANMVANALAALVLSRSSASENHTVVGHLRSALITIKGVRLDPVQGSQDNTLQGWPWVRDTFSWVEPTAWCLLALKRLSVGTVDLSSAQRIDEAERLLLDRVCQGGGWNYGNAHTLGQDLRPYVPTTAVALMALRDKRHLEQVAVSVAELQRSAQTERSATALSLASLAMRLHGLPTDAVDESLVAAPGRSEARGHLHASALALTALTADTHLVEMFRVGP